jgi:outer membrane protein OmpA-like peptidoglycan-associated protein
MHKLALVSVAASVAASLLIGCSHEQPAPHTASSDVTITNAPIESTPRPETDQILNVGPSLRALCGIDDAARAPKFDFDKAKLSGNDREIASKIANCMTTGPMQGKSVSLIGRADPRGTEQHNMTLAQERADAFKTYLVSLGVDGARMQDSSRGALDARGTNEETWRQDRRVDIEVTQ